MHCIHGSFLYVPIFPVCSILLASGETRITSVDNNRGRLGLERHGLANVCYWKRPGRKKVYFQSILNTYSAFPIKMYSIYLRQMLSERCACLVCNAAAVFFRCLHHPFLWCYHSISVPWLQLCLCVDLLSLCTSRPPSWSI